MQAFPANLISTLQAPQCRSHAADPRHLNTTTHRIALRFRVH
jgi:hypothetical protein